LKVKLAVSGLLVGSLESPAIFPWALAWRLVYFIPKPFQAASFMPNNCKRSLPKRRCQPPLAIIFKVPYTEPMAKKKPLTRRHLKPGAKEKLTKDMPDFYAKLGSRGGDNTLRNNGPLFFSRIAHLAHQKRRENAAARELENDARAAR
jgi:hypothetical protein